VENSVWQDKKIEFAKRTLAFLVNNEGKITSDRKRLGGQFSCCLFTIFRFSFYSFYDEKFIFAK